MPIDQFRVAQRTRESTDIQAWQVAELGYVIAAAMPYVTVRTARDDAYQAASLALIKNTNQILDKVFEGEAALRAYINQVVKHAAMAEVDEVTTVAGLGPAWKTKLKRVAGGRKALKRHDPRPRLVPGINSGFDGFEGDSEAANKWLRDRRIDPIEQAEREMFYRGACTEAYKLASCDPTLTAAMKYAQGSCHHFDNGTPSISKLAAAVGLKRETLRDRLRRLGRRLAALDPEGGIEYLGKVWEAAARSDSGDFSDLGGERAAA